MDITMMTPTQRRTFDELLAVGGERPFARQGLVDELRSALTEKVKPAVQAWTEPRLWMSKSMVTSICSCEGRYLQEKSQPRTVGMFPAVAVGTITHRAIQLAHTHPGGDPESYVRAAVTGSREDAKFATFWDEADQSTQSDVIVSAISRYTAFVDSWPPLESAWVPRFEEPVQAKAGLLTLSGRPDLLLGRPRPGGKMTMVVADWKTGALNDRHVEEAGFYALTAALRFGVPPYRSTVFSLASGEWTDPDVTEESLWAAVDTVAAAARAHVEVLTEARAPERLCEAAWCQYCTTRGAPVADAA